MKLQMTPDELCVQEAAHEEITEIVYFPVFPRDEFGRNIYHTRPKRDANGDLIMRKCNLAPSQTMRNVIDHLNFCMAGGNCKGQYQFAMICAHWKKCTRGNCPFRAGGKTAASEESSEKYFQFAEDHEDYIPPATDTSKPKA